MEGCFTFQRGGGVVFQIRELHFLSGGCAPWGASVLMGGVFKKKSYDGGVGRFPCPLSTMGNHEKWRKCFQKQKQLRHGMKFIVIFVV